MVKPQSRKPKPLTNEERRSTLIVIFFLAFIFSRCALVPSASYLAEANDKETDGMITLPFDVSISVGFSLSLAMLRAITSDLSSRWMINFAILYAYVIFFFVSAVTVPNLHLYVRLAAAVVTNLVFWLCGNGKLPEA